MSKVSKAPSIDDVRAQFASAIQVYWVCPVTKKSIPADDTVAIETHKNNVIAAMEAKEVGKLRQKVLRDLNAEVSRIDSMAALRDWAFRRIGLDIPHFVASDVPAMSVYFPKLAEVHTEHYAYIRLGGGKALTSEIKTALNAKQGKAFSKERIGKGVDNAWFMVIPLSTGLGLKITAWLSRKSKKLSMEDKAGLHVSNPEYSTAVEQLKALGIQIHALRDQARALAVKCDTIRFNALTVLPQDLT